MQRHIHSFIHTYIHTYKNQAAKGNNALKGLSQDVITNQVNIYSHTHTHTHTHIYIYIYIYTHA
jgi:hypothetical protein